MSSSISAAPLERLELVLGSGLRLIAANTIDILFCAALSFAALAVALEAAGVERLAVQPFVDFAHASPTAAVLILLGAPAFVIAVYHAITVVSLGGTLGQRVLRLRVARAATGAKPGLVRAVVRAFIVAASTVFLLVGPLYGVLIDRRRRGLADVLTGCVVAVRTGGREGEPA